MNRTPLRIAAHTHGGAAAALRCGGTARATSRRWRATRRRTHSGATGVSVAQSWTRLRSRGVIQLTGSQTHSFLQGLVTNDVHLLSPNAASGDDSDERLEACQYNSLLSPKGRVLYEMILWAGHAIDAPDAEQCLWLECDAEMIPALQKHLTKFRLRADVTIANVSSTMGVFVPPANCTVPKGQIALDVGKADGVVQIDPRCREMGLRAVLPIAPGSDADADAEAQAAAEVQYHRSRAQLGLLEGAREVVPERFFPSELCLDYLGAVNFNKGCYVGQELTARTHFRGVVRKRILPVHISGPSSGHGGGDAQAAIVVPPADGEQAAKEIGKLIAVPGDGDIGVASLRLDPILEQGAHGLRTADGRRIVPFIPAWWATKHFYYDEDEEEAQEE